MPDIFVAKNNKEANDQKLKTESYSGHAHMFASFCPNPVGVSFRDQKEGEDILLFLRRHFVTNIPWIFISLVLALLPLIFFAANLRFSIFDLSNITFSSIALTLILYYLIVFAFIFVNFITWYYNVSLVTNKRIVDIDFSGLLYKNVAETTLSLVQDVSFTQVGTIASFFDYGDVNIQTAGTLDNFDFTSVPQPQRVVQIVGDLIGRKKP